MHGAPSLPGPGIKHIKFVSELPMTGVGKVDKKVLKAGLIADVGGDLRELRR